VGYGLVWEAGTDDAGVEGGAAGGEGDEEPGDCAGDGDDEQHGEELSQGDFRQDRDEYAAGVGVVVREIAGGGEDTWQTCRQCRRWSSRWGIGSGGE